MRVGVTMATFAVLAAIVLLAAPMSLEAPFLGFVLTGSDSALTLVGSYALVLLLAAALARGALRLALSRRPEWERSLRLGVVLVPVVALAGLLVPESVHEYARLASILGAPAALAVSIGAATAWVALRRPQRSASSSPSLLSKEPER